MRREGRLPELLSPAGDFDSLVAAVLGGADAVYIGGKSFSARAYAKNFDIDGIRAAVRYCHIHGVKLYVALNTLVYDREIREAVKYAAELYRVGVDALICADLGIIREIRRVIPDFEIHASTQASVHNSLGADEAAALGVKRVVLARELSLPDVIGVTEGCAVETEIFLHGALCVCHSGQCLFSSLAGGRSGNRGECAQPCRLPYNGKYPLSLKDLALAEHIPALIGSGVASLKIEGRMKSPDYVYRVTRIYRRLLDEGRRATDAEMRELAAIFSRGGFTDGYITGKLSGGMTGVRSEQDKEMARELDPLELAPRKRRISARVRIVAGEPMALELFLDGRTASSAGPVPQVAQSSPLDVQGVRERLCKMGGTNLSLAPEDIECEIGEGLNASPAAINAMRREAAEALECSDRELIDLSDYAPKTERATARRALRTAQFLDADAYLEYASGTDEGYLDIAFLPLFSEALSKLKSTDGIGVYLPPVIMEGELTEVRERLLECKNAGILYTVVSNIGHFRLAEECGMRAIGDFRLNVASSLSAKYWRDRGLEGLICSCELTLPMARDIGEGEIVYGRIPLMITERCFIKDTFGCEGCASAELTDRMGKKFPMKREWRHRNLILNSAVTYMADKQDELSRMGIKHMHFIFTTESAEQIAETVAAYKRRLPARDPSSIRRIGSLTAKMSSADQKDKSGARAKKKPAERTARNPHGAPQGRGARGGKSHAKRR